MFNGTLISIWAGALQATARNPAPDPYFELFKSTLDTITIIIGIAAAVVTVMSFLGYRNISSQRERLEGDIRQLRSEVREDTRRLQDQLKIRVAKIDQLIDKFERESANRLKQLEERAGGIHGIATTAQQLLSQIQEASTKGEKLISDLEAKFEARAEAIILKMTGGKPLDAADREIIATREAEIVKKEEDERTAKDWFFPRVKSIRRIELRGCRSIPRIRATKRFASESAGVRV